MSRQAFGGAVPRKGAERGQSVGVVKMGHRDDPRAVCLRRRDDGIGEDGRKDGAALVLIQAPLIEDDERARGFDEVEKLGQAGEAVGVRRQEIDGDEIGVVLFDGLGERQFDEPVVEQPAPKIEDCGATALDRGCDGFFEPRRVIAGGHRRGRRESAVYGREAGIDRIAIDDIDVQAMAGGAVDEPPRPKGLAGSAGTDRQDELRTRGSAVTLLAKRVWDGMSRLPFGLRRDRKPRCGANKK